MAISAGYLDSNVLRIFSFRRVIDVIVSVDMKDDICAKSVTCIAESSAGTVDGGWIKAFLAVTGMDLEVI